MINLQNSRCVTCCSRVSPYLRLIWKIVLILALLFISAWFARILLQNYCRVTWRRALQKFIESANHPIEIQNSNFPQICYKENPATILFFHARNHSEWHPFEMCAIKRAATANPDAKVCVLTQIPMKEYLQLKNLSNLEISLLNISKIIENTPIYGAEKLSDALSFAYLYKYGGKYLDTDVWTLKNFRFLRNTIGWEIDQSILSSAVLFFEKGHPYLKAVLDNFAKLMMSKNWAWSGSQLLTGIYAQKLIDNTTYNLLPSHAFFPVPVQKFASLFKSEKFSEVYNLTKGAYTVSLWRKMHPDRWNEELVKGSYVHGFFNHYCI